jgi:uncharacterized protein (DUF1015 family)
MAEIRPFRAVYYNRSVVGNLSEVICPPYDIINTRMEEELYQRNTYNFVRIENNRQMTQDSNMDNRYTRSAAKLKQWLEEKVLITAEAPAIYVHDHYFFNQGQKYKRSGLIVRAKIEEWHKNIIRPHEGTMMEARSDRINLLEAIKTNTSPIMLLYQDREKCVSSILESQQKSGLLINFEDNSGERHEVWQINEPEVVAEMCAGFADKPLYIADGHHRYESSLIYKRQMLAASSASREDAAINYVMTTLFDFDDPGLVILPPHRLLRGLPEIKLAGLADKLGSFFEIEYLPLDLPNLWQRVDGLMADISRVNLVLFGPDRQKLLILTLRDAAAADRMIPYFHSEIYKRLETT